MSYSESVLSYYRRSFGQSLLVSGHDMGPATNFPFLSFGSTDSKRTDKATTKSKSKSKFHYDRRLVGQSLLVSGNNLENAINYSFSSTRIFFINLGFLFWSDYREVHEHNMHSQFWNSTKLEGLVPVFIFPRFREAQLYLQTSGKIETWPISQLEPPRNSSRAQVRHNLTEKNW
jgi:hypothetical protein